MKTLKEFYDPEITTTTVYLPRVEHYKRWGKKEGWICKQIRKIEEKLYKKSLYNMRANSQDTGGM